MRQSQPVSCAFCDFLQTDTGRILKSVLKGVIHHEFVPRGQRVNGQFCLAVMKRLREAKRRKRPEECRNKTWMLHNDITLARMSLLVRQFLAKPGRRFQTIKEMEEKSLWDPRTIPQNAF
jgi:hypothetical protein